MSRHISALGSTHAYFDPDSPTVIVGDFNIDLLHRSSDKRQLHSLLLDTYGYHHTIEGYTIDYNSQLDHIHTNMSPSSYISAILESHLSDHESAFNCFLKANTNPLVLHVQFVRFMVGSLEPPFGANNHFFCKFRGDN